ncbi:hypothetical protein Bhyg_13114 [Pseudolycoriella hygida]|uniref:Uncharacterized protein n=1 Tax=Pseudolycoriella hygida TaxID=35572 RepID=A0A9Q0MZL0_9DIPT|nr:hypothetical protein Bhyg_13114 [Pseudolycoriella hygida]
MQGLKFINSNDTSMLIRRQLMTSNPRTIGRNEAKSLLGKIIYQNLF